MSLFARARADQARTYKANDAARYTQIQAEKRAAAQTSNKTHTGDKYYYTDIQLTDEDIAAGIKIVMVDGKAYKDVSAPINSALYDIKKQAELVKAGKVVVDGVGQGVTGYAASRAWFISKVYHRADWDIKREAPWNDTIGKGTYPGSGTKVYYFGALMTPEELGNYTYGFIGAALGAPLPELYAGSWVAAGLPVSGDELAGEFNDWPAIEKGFNAYFKRGSR